MTDAINLTPAAQPAPAVPAAEPLALSWAQPPGLIGLSVKNFALRIATLGIYGFWGKTEVRQRIWSAIRLNGEPLQYTGTGRELFLGFLVIFGVILLPVLLVSLVVTVAFGPQSPALAAFQLLLYVGFFYLIGVGIHRAQRYRLSRTRWRGIRGGLEGSSWAYAWTHFWTGLLIPFTLGWIAPWRSTRLQGLITSGMRLGDRPFQFSARSGPLYRRFAVLWIGALVIFVAVLMGMGGLMAAVGLDAERLSRTRGNPGIGLIALLLAVVYGSLLAGALLYGVLSAWYRAGMMNHFAAHTTFEGARFSGSATAGSLIWLTVSNTALVLFTLGLLAPLAQARAARYFIERLSITGTAPLAQIAQRSADELKRGEGLAQVFDVDAF